MTTLVANSVTARPVPPHIMYWAAAKTWQSAVEHWWRFVGACLACCLWSASSAGRAWGICCDRLYSAATHPAVVRSWLSTRHCAIQLWLSVRSAAVSVGGFLRSIAQGILFLSVFIVAFHASVLALVAAQFCNAVRRVAAAVAGAGRSCAQSLPVRVARRACLAAGRLVWHCADAALRAVFHLGQALGALGLFVLLALQDNVLAAKQGLARACQKSPVGKKFAQWQRQRDAEMVQEATARGLCSGSFSFGVAGHSVLARPTSTISSATAGAAGDCKYGVVSLSHAEAYSLLVHNGEPASAVDCEVWVGSDLVGSYRVDAGGWITIDRPVRSNKRFVFARYDGLECSSDAKRRGETRREYDESQSHVTAVFWQLALPDGPAAPPPPLSSLDGQGSVEQVMGRRVRRAEPVARKGMSSSFYVPEPEEIVATANLDAPDETTRSVTRLAGLSSQELQPVRDSLVRDPTKLPVRLDLTLVVDTQLDRQQQVSAVLRSSMKSGTSPKPLALDLLHLVESYLFQCVLV